MVTRDVFQFFRNTTTSRQYRKQSRQRIQHEPALRLQPTLLTLPLLTTDSSAAHVEQLLANHQYIVVRGHIGSGRSLLLKQLAWQWLSTAENDPLLYLPLDICDRPAQPPQAVILDVAQEAGLPSPFETTGKGQKRRWLLLFDDWELLTEPRRSEWQTYLLTLPRLLPTAQIVLAAPVDGAYWHSMHSIDLAAPDEPDLKRWLAHLLPQHDPTPILEALQPGQPLATLPRRVLDVALLALTYPSYGLALSREQLYTWSYDQLVAITPDSTDTARFAGLSIGKQSLYCYETARTFAAEARPQAVADLGGETRAQVMRLLAGMLPDPAPLYEALWNEAAQDASSPDDLLILGHCLRDRIKAAPEWEIQVIAALSRQPDSEPHRALLAKLAPSLPAVLAAATRHSTLPQAGSLLNKLAPLVGGVPLLALASNTNAPEALRWQAADALLCLPAASIYEQMRMSPPSDTLAEALYSYVLALGESTGRHVLAQAPATGWLDALRDERIDHERRAHVARALLDDTSTPAVLRSAVLALIPRSDTAAHQTTQAMLQQACADPDAAVRQPALAALSESEPQQTLAILGAILTWSRHPWEVQRDVLERLGGCMQPEGSMLLARSTLFPHIPLAGRLRALELLARRRQGGSVLLPRFLQIHKAHLVIRSAAIRLLTRRRDTKVLAEICAIAANDEELLVRQTAIEALGLLGQHADDTAGPLATLCLVLEDTSSPLPLVQSAIRALGVLGQTEAVPVLSSLLQADLYEYVADTWLTQAPELAEALPGEWVSLPLSDELRVALLSIVAAGESEAHRPGDFDELVREQTRTLRAEIVEALAHIARQQGGATQMSIRDLLIDVVQWVTPETEAQCIIAGLGRASSDDGLQDLGHLLAKPDLNPVLRWLVVDQLAENPAAGSLLLNSLEQAVLDPFTRGKLALSLGRRNMLAALPVLRRLAEQRDGDGYVRMCATEALGMIIDPAVETTLLHIIADVTAAPALRGTAAEALPATIGEEIRRWLNELLRRERQPAELVVGALRALSRTSDAEVPGLLLQYVHSDQPAIAIAAMTGLRTLEDQRVVPTLARLAQNPTIDQRVRLHAVATLLHFSETDYLPLLRSFLDGGILTFQLQALDCLLNARPADSRPLQLLADKSAPLALRQRSLEALRQRPDNHGVLCRLVADGGEDTHLRVTAAAILAESSYPDAIATLERYARESSAPLRLRRQCIEALEQQARRDSSEMRAACYVLGKLAADPTLPAESHMWAASALVALL